MVFPSELYTFRLFKWATLIRNTRMFTYPSPEPGHTNVALVPVGDLLNHNSACDRKGFFFNIETASLAQSDCIP